MKRHILFSFRRCPYAIRARWAIKACGLEVELREVNLKNKPSEFLKNSSSKTVPLLILKNGVIIEESLEIVLWALQTSINQYANKYYKKISQNKINKIINENDNIFKFHLDRFKYSSRFNDNKKELHFLECQKFIKSWNSLLNDSTNIWLIDNQESIADWCLWPFVRQFKIACDSEGISNYFDEPLEIWFNYFAKHKYFQEVMYKYSFWENSSLVETFPKNLD
tara:strand:+ start:546 stop:1214 length:669 start_codon:yes stop_codon:yes gene_type:complete